ncbi:MAG: DUF2752 domain-containing protein [Tannerella sp.]|jgi:hypothetical protein|nr:DUF2752 domain-containing protein [Tannerella sp.]
MDMRVDRKKRIGIGLAIMVLLLAGIYLYSQYNPENYLFFPKCPVYTLTGYKCPGCGSQRAFYHLFHGNFVTAFMYNPLMMLLVPYVLFGIYIEYMTDRNNPRIVYLRNLFFGKWAVLILAVIILLYTISRNLLF